MAGGTYEQWMVLASVAMFLLTIGLLFHMAIARNLAVMRREVSVRFYRTYDQGEETPRLHLLARHVQNQFEIPPLFHIAVVLTLVTDSASLTSVALAWTFVAARLLHTVVHLSTNNVLHRFLVFGVGLVVLTAMWLRLGILQFSA